MRNTATFTRDAILGREADDGHLKREAWSAVLEFCAVSYGYS